MINKKEYSAYGKRFRAKTNENEITRQDLPQETLAHHGISHWQ